MRFQKPVARFPWLVLLACPFPVLGVIQTISKLQERVCTSHPPVQSALSAMYKGDTRTRTIEVYVDGTLVATWTSSGTTSGFESIDLSGVSGSMIEITGVLGNSEWLSIVEVSFLLLLS